MADGLEVGLGQMTIGLPRAVFHFVTCYAGCRTDFAACETYITQTHQVPTPPMLSNGKSKSSINLMEVI